MNKYKKLIIFILIAANIATWSFVYAHKSHEFMTVAFLDVGQGDAIFIEAPNGVQMLVDTSPGEIVVRKLSEMLPYFDRSIDIVLTTHPDLDHIGGLPSILDRYSVGQYIFHDNSPTNDIIETITEKIADKKVPTGHVLAGDRIVLDVARNIYLDVLWPTPAFKTTEKNDLSIILKLTYGEQDFILTGDASLKIENMLLSEYGSYNDGKYLQSEVLKLGHHGSKTSSFELFLRKVAPDFAVVSAGLDNKFKHPSVEVVARLEKLQLESLRTMGEGSVIFKTDGKSLWTD